MFSLKTILFAATAALAGVASAAPTHAVVGRSLEGAGSPLVARCGCESIPDILTKLNGQLVGILANVHATVDGKVNVNVDVVSPLITQTVVVVKAAVDALHAEIIINLDIAGLLTLNGAAVSVDVCAKLILEILVNICLIIQVILEAVGSIQVAVIIKLCVGLSVVVCDLLKIIIQLVAGIDVKIAALVNAYAGLAVHINLCGLVGVLAVVGIHI